jgi:hypothetical protein
METLAVVTGTIALGKQLLDLVKSSKDGALKLAVSELQVKLAEVNNRVADLLNENRELKDTVRKKAEPPEVEFSSPLIYRLSPLSLKS